jgi:hypothetical protein
MRVNVAIPEQHVTAPVLDAALEAVTKLNEQLIKSGAAPKFTDAQHSVSWKPEPPGAEHFDNAGIVAHRGHGDCDDLAPWLAAERRVTGVDPGAQAVVVPSGPQRWHAIVKRSNGTYEDPSEATGMRGKRHAIAGAAVPLMSAPMASVSGAFTLRPQLALRPNGNGGWQGRADIPWNWRASGEATPGEIAMVSLHQHPVASTALVGAIDGALDLAETNGGCDGDHVERLLALRNYADGMPLHEVAELYGHEHARAAHNVIGSFWGHLAHLVTSPITAPIAAAKHIAKGDFKGVLHDFTAPVHDAMGVVQPLGKALKPFTPLMRFVPGIGPMAATAVDLAAHGLPTSFSDLAHMAAQQGAGFIPGIGPIASAVMNNPFAQAAQHFAPMAQQFAQNPFTAAPSMMPGGSWPAMFR